MPKQWSMELRRKVGHAHGEAKYVAKLYGVSVGGVYEARNFVRREMNGERYDESTKLWVKDGFSDERTLPGPEQVKA
jgi:hypothetical protein